MKLTADLESSFWIYAKAILFLLIGIISISIILIETQSFRVGVLVFLSIWSFCRLYYFIFYVIEKYVDPTFKFAGLTAFAVYLFSGKVSNRKHVK